MKYQDPLSPTDSTQFLTQTAQFTGGEHAATDRKDQQAIQHTNELLAASGMVGRGVTYSTTGIAPSTAIATSTVSVGGNLAQDAPVGAHVTVNTTAYNNIGSQVPLQLQFTHRRRLVDAGVEQRADDRRAVGHHVRRDRSNARAPTSPRRKRFDIERYDRDPGRRPVSRSTWDPRTTRTGSRWGANVLHTAVLSQNGGDGQTLTGIVTGVHITADGPQLQIDGRDVPLASVTEVQAPAL